MKKTDLVEAAVNLAEVDTGSRPSLAVLSRSARIPMTGAKQRRPVRGVAWTPTEDVFLKSNLGTLSVAEIGRALGRTAAAIHNRWKRDLHLPAPRRNPGWLTLEAFSCGIGIDGHQAKALVERGLIQARRLPSDNPKKGHGIRVVDRKLALEWIADPMHWIYFKPERVGLFRKRGQRHMGRPDVVFWREARAAIERSRRTWKDAWLTPLQTARLIGLPINQRRPLHCHGINKAIHLKLLPAVRWGNWRILRSEALKFARDRVERGWGKRKINRIRFSDNPQGRPPAMRKTA